MTKNNSKWNLCKKKKKTIIYLISGLIAILGIGVITYLAWPKKQAKTEIKSQSKENIQQLQNQLSQIKNVLNKPENASKKVKYSAQLTDLENKIKIFLSNNNQEQEKTIQEIEKDIKEINQELKIPEKTDDPKPNPDKPTKTPTPEEKDKEDNPNDKNPPNPDPQPDNNNNEVVIYVATKLNDNTYKYRFKTTGVNGEKLTWKKVIRLLEWKYANFFQAFQGALKDANSKFPAYFWKCPPVSKNTLGKPFEFVVIKTDSFNNVPQDYSKFQEHFGKSRDNQAVSFFSPSGNCLISPVPKGTADYINISKFTKNAPDEQQQALWKEVVDSLMKELKKDADTPRWLNTEGTGVYYLHVRIDKSNRFYSDYKEYEKFE